MTFASEADFTWGKRHLVFYPFFEFVPGEVSQFFDPIGYGYFRSPSVFNADYDTLIRSGYNPYDRVRGAIHSVWNIEVTSELPSEQYPVVSNPPSTWGYLGRKVLGFGFRIPPMVLKKSPGFVPSVSPPLFYPDRQEDSIVNSLSPSLALQAACFPYDLKLFGRYLELYGVQVVY